MNAKVTAKPKGALNVTLLIVYINVALYATCFQIQRPLEPFMVDKLNLSGDSSGEYARLQSFFSVMQTIGSFISGRFLDKFGAKGGFIISFLSSAACYALLSQATTLRILYLSKIPTIFQAGFLCAQVAAAQATSDGAERVAALGRLTMSYTVGSVLGPTVGGMLGASGDYYLGAKIAVAGSLLSVVLSLFMPNEKGTQHSMDTTTTTATTTATETPAVAAAGGINKRDGTHAHVAASTDQPIVTDALHADKNDLDGDIDSEVSSKDNNIPSTISVIRIVWLFLSTKVITSVANAMAGAAFPLILKDIYGLDEKALGFSMSFMSACNAVVNGLFLGPIVRAAGNDLNTVIAVCVCSMAVLSGIQAMLAVNGVPSFLSFLPDADMYEYLLTSFVLSMFQYVLSTTITGESTARVGPKAKGTLLGLEHSLFAAARVVAPTTGVYLLQQGGISAVAGASSAVFAGVFALWQSCADKKKPAFGCDGERKEK